MTAPFSETGVFGPVAALASAPVIGFAFGWCLERGGLGSARKLTAQFYLTDLAVFKVMFSALVTAMLGAFWLDRAGVLDLGPVYLPETYVVPQAIGGLMFGAGFLVGGLCPGTACVAAASGRLDGLAVMGGMLLGVVTFNVAFEWIRPLFESTPLGAVTLTQLAGVPVAVGVLAITAAALVGFALAARLPSEARSISRAKDGALALLAGFLAVAAVSLELGSSAGAAQWQPPPLDPDDYVSAPDLAVQIVGQDATLRVFDLRSRQDFERLHVAGATHATLDELGHQPISHDARIVVYADDEARAAKGLRLLQAHGYRNVAILREGIYEWISRVLEPRVAADATASERAEFDRAAQLSRFFGGMPRSDVRRAELPRGYWTGAPATQGRSREFVRQAIAGIRRRGC
jgi:uncharacterized protein